MPKLGVDTRQQSIYVYVELTHLPLLQRRLQLAQDAYQIRICRRILRRLPVCRTDVGRGHAIVPLTPAITTKSTPSPPSPPFKPPSPPPPPPSPPPPPPSPSPPSPPAQPRIALAYLPAQQCGYEPGSTTYNPTRYPGDYNYYTYPNQASATAACIAVGCDGLASRAELAHAIYPYADGGPRIDFCGFGWVRDSRHRYMWMASSYEDGCRRRAGWSSWYVRYPNHQNPAGAYCSGCPLAEPSR